MATIPQVIDYGARPSLRSDRLDIPGEGELDVANAIERAANTFGAVMIERKEKQDSFNYNMAKQEYLTADLTRRESLKDDREYETFDERYRGWMGDDRAEILTKRRLSPHDLAIFHAEADLIDERGASSVQEYRRVLEIDDNLSDLEASLSITKEKVLLAAPGEANEIMLTALDQINAAEDMLWLEELPAQKMREDVVQTVSAKRLSVMDPKERERILEASLAYRKGTGGPITAQDIRDGKGTDTIADFLHTDTLKEMLKATKKELEIDTAQAEGYAAKDEAWVIFKGLSPESMKGRSAFYRDAGLSAEARKAAEAADARQVLIEDNIRQEEWRAIDTELRRMIEEEGRSFSELPGEMVSKLPGAMQNALEAKAIRTRRQEDFPDQTSYDAIEAYADLTPQQQAEWSVDDWMVSPPMMEPKRWGDHVDREQADLWANAAGQKKKALAAGITPESGLTETQQLENIFGLVMKKPTASSDHATWKKWHRMMNKYNNAVIAAGSRGELTPEQRLKIAMDITRFEVYQREFPTDQKRNYAILSEEQIEASYLPLSEPVPPFAQTAYTMRIKHDADPDLGLPAFDGLAHEWLKQTGSALNPTDPGKVPDDKVLEEAWFYLVTQGPEAAINQLRGLPGY